MIQLHRYNRSVRRGERNDDSSKIGEKQSCTVRWSTQQRALQARYTEEERFAEPIFLYDSTRSPRRQQLLLHAYGHESSDESYETRGKRGNLETRRDGRIVEHLFGSPRTVRDRAVDKALPAMNGVICVFSQPSISSFRMRRKWEDAPAEANSTFP
jgi:hypothetical protein